MNKTALQACFIIWHLQFIDFIIHHYEKKEICPMTEEGVTFLGNVLLI